MPNYEFSYGQLRIPVFVEYVPDETWRGKRQEVAVGKIDPTRVTLKGEPIPRLNSLDDELSFRVNVTGRSEAARDKLLRIAARRVVRFNIIRPKDF